MKPQRSLPAECRKWLETFDSGVTEPEHLAACEGCAREVEARKGMFNRVRLAQASVPVPPGLESRILTAIQAPAEARPGWRGASIWMAAAAALIVTFGVGIAYQLGHLRWTEGMQDSYIASVSNQVASILRVGLKDHLHCAYYGKYPKTPPAREEFARSLGTEYRELLQVVAQHAPAGYRIVAAHRCVAEGRNYVHLAMRGEGRLVSLVITAKGEGESFTALRPELLRGDTRLFQAQAQRFAISAFETERHLVYTVSDLLPAENMKLMAAMAPQVRGVLARAL